MIEKTGDIRVGNTPPEDKNVKQAGDPLVSLPGHTSTRLAERVRGVIEKRRGPIPEGPLKEKDW